MILAPAARFTTVGLLAAAASAALLPATSPTAAASPTADSSRTAAPRATEPRATGQKAGRSCRETRIPVDLPTGGVTATVSGTLCTPADWTAGRPEGREIDVLVHGGSYNRAYWDWPQDTSLYSYVRRANADGRATFAYDRLGAGETTRPPSPLVTVASDASTLHQVIRWIRSDYQTVNLVSHSIGGLVAIEEAARYQDVDSLVVTGMLHGVGIGPSGAGTFTNFYPAALDPVYQGATPDLGWVTSRPGTRRTSFYHTKTADPDVIAYDEAHKDLTTEATIITSALSNKLPTLLNAAGAVRAPVLVVVGQQDDMFCGVLLDCTNEDAVRANEAPYYVQAESLTVETVPDTGHNLTLHPSSGTSYALIADWLETR